VKASSYDASVYRVPHICRSEWDGSQQVYKRHVQQGSFQLDVTLRAGRARKRMKRHEATRLQWLPAWSTGTGREPEKATWAMNRCRRIRNAAGRTDDRRALTDRRRRSVSASQDRTPALTLAGGPSPTSGVKFDTVARERCGGVGVVAIECIDPGQYDFSRRSRE
jgi:hypothetical protein